MKSRPSCPLTSKCRTTRGADRLNKLRTIAAEMFLKRGYEGVSVEMLIDRVGGSRRNVYGHFGNKKGLFVEAVQAIGADAGQPLMAVVLDGVEASDGLARFASALLDLVLQPRSLAMHRLMIAEGQRFPDLSRSLCDSGRDRAAAKLGAWMSTLQSGGALRPELEPVALADQFITMVVCGPQLRGLLGQLPVDWVPDGIQRHINDTVDLFLRGAAALRPA